jgi:hypothetical protein
MKTMKNHGELDGQIHYWQSWPNQWLLSFESAKQLVSFETVDDMINFLYISGYKEQARELNKRKKTNDRI